ncbi:P-loop containing nucleoside triphosphate hydrolase protein [Syncephalastrum racemosum]|uniref:P-loop containing nucleoside triphosphate hydrolase protein n=1 Tax=Syncephalastrum racemosum TaxID=13706 RepID=A0A1X2HE88_SYNRA|nr:P-loop containing nucleoside triphosphate hydrolase protein [Syncephalastrum racemosum]
MTATSRHDKSTRSENLSAQAATNDDIRIASSLADMRIDNDKSAATPTQEQARTDNGHEHDGHEDVDDEDEVKRSLKSMLLEATPDDSQGLKELIERRITEGHGETLFEIGLEEDGTSMELTEAEFETALKTVSSLTQTLGAGHAIIEKRVVQQKADLEPGVYAHLMIRRRPASVEDMLEIRVAVVGNVDAGKSTLLGVLTKGGLDDGRGKARLNLFRHKHEIESGRTSSVGGEILGFDADSKAILHPDNHSARKMSWDAVCAKAAKVLSFVDLAGHERYLKTTVFGMTGSAPEFVMLMIGANAGIIGMTKEHLGLALSLNIPVLVVVTKIDRCPPKILQNTMKELNAIMKSKSCRKIPYVIESDHDVVFNAQNFLSERLCPIFKISNVTGEGLDRLRTFLNILPSQSTYNTEEDFHYEINETYSVPFVGTVVSGILHSGIIRLQDKVLIGPDQAGQFAVTAIKGIQRKRSTVYVARAGQSVTFALKNVRRNAIHKGMVLLAYDKDKPMPKATRKFEAEIRVLYHSTTIKQKYQAMVHIGAVRQSATILTMEEQVLRTGDKANVQFELIRNPEYLVVGTRLIFREGRTKGVGTITKLL